MAKYKNLGIDFGACTIKISRYQESLGEVKAVEVAKDQHDDDKKTPNVIRYDSRDNFTIGKVAVRSKNNPKYEGCIVEGIKRKLELKDWKKEFPTYGFTLTTQDIIKDIFAAIKTAFDNKRETYENAVVTVPVCYAELQKQIICEAARAAGFPIEDCITEPVAALFAFEEFFEEECDEYVVIFDFGGATLDLCLYHIENDGAGNIEINVESTSGWNFGGFALTELLYKQIVYPKYKAMIEAEIVASSRAKVEADMLDLTEEMKNYLFEDGNEKETEAETFYIDAVVNRNDALVLERQEVEKCLTEFKLKEKIIAVLDDLFAESDVEKDEVTKVKAIGGTSRIIGIRKILEEYFGNEIYDSSEYDSMIAYRAVADGASRYACIIANEESTITLHNSIGYNVGIEENGQFKKVISRNQKYGVYSPRRNISTKTLEENDFKFTMYQSFKDTGTAIGVENGAIYMGSVQATTDRFTGLDSVIYRFGTDNKGRAVIEFSLLDVDSAEAEFKVIEVIPLEIGG